MSLSEETAPLAEVAAALGRSPGWLRNNWAKLAAERGFPRKLPTGPVWPRKAVAAWLRAGGVIEAAVMPVNDNGPEGDVVEQYRQELAVAYGGAA